MAIAFSPSENGGGPPPAAYGAKFGRDAVPSLLIGIDPVSGNPYPLSRDPISGGLNISSFGSLPKHGRPFRATVVPGAVAVQLIPASTDGRGKIVTNASVANQAAGVDCWVGFDNTATDTANSTYLGPGSEMSFVGQEAIFVYVAAGAAGNCLVTAAEEYT